MNGLRIKSRLKKGQTLLEYMMVIMAFVIPVAAAIRASLNDEGKKKNIITYLIKDSYGSKGEPGVIGRPYP